MAKYDITYSCGHSTVMELYGARKERDRKIAYFEKSGLCKECYIAERKAQDAAAPRVVQVKVYSLGGPPMIACIATGGLDANKEALKGIGFRWTDEAIGALGFLSMKRELHFAITREVEDPELTGAWLRDIETRVGALGYTCEFAGNILDGAFYQDALRYRDEQKAKKAAAKEQERLAKEQRDKEAAEKLAAKLAANPRPQRPDWYDVMMQAGGSCNGKVYGSAGRWSIYVNGVKKTISNEQKVEFEAYFARYRAYQAAKA